MTSLADKINSLDREHKCETCGTPVVTAGKTTRYYESAYPKMRDIAVILAEALEISNDIACEITTNCYGKCNCGKCKLIAKCEALLKGGEDERA